MRIGMQMVSVSECTLDVVVDFNIKLSADVSDDDDVDDDGNDNSDSDFAFGYAPVDDSVDGTKGLSWPAEICNFEQMFCKHQLFYEKQLLYENTQANIKMDKKDKDFEELIETIDIISIEYDNIIVAGDFNSNLLVERCLADSMQTLGLLPVNDSAPTHFTRSNASLLDVFFVSHLSKISLYNQLDAPAFSKHDLLFVTYHFEINPTVCTSTYRDFKNIDWPLLHQSLDEVPWEEIFYMEGVDEQVSFLNHNLCSIYDTFVPVKVIYTNRKQQPWFTPEIKHLISVRNLAYKRWKRYRLPTLYDTFKSARRDVLKKTNESKKQYYKRKFENAIDSKRKWKEIRNIGIGSKSNTNTDCLSISDLDEINENFLKINTVDPGTNTYSNISTAQIEDTFSFRCVSPEEVLQSFATIKSDAMGFDGIHPRFAKLVLPKILPFVTHIYNNILTKSTFPTDWKLAKIIPIPKQNSEFRPIAILPFFSKALERIINTQIDAFLSFRGLLNDRQSGFRTKRNCSTVLIDVVEELRQNMDNNMVSFLVLLDHSKAFDTVNHDILISKLDRLFFFSKPACKLISSYITGRRQSVNVGDTTSAALDVPRGVPQGSILGPLLFSVYINDLPDIPMHCNVQMYADDVQLFSSAKPNCVQSCINNINCDLNEIQNWASKNSLCLNPSKTKLMKILKRSTTQIPPVRATLNNSVIETVDTSCNLGVIFNSKLTWTNHINKAVGKVQGMLRKEEVKTAINDSTDMPPGDMSIRLTASKTREQRRVFAPDRRGKRNTIVRETKDWKEGASEVDTFNGSVKGRTEIKQAMHQVRRETTHAKRMQKKTEKYYLL
ncbi:uncharacterized protein LOC131994740 [Stomoxys calcitrans]|uniref:uncharacterized protein LOC131994740 n=1 Tax=Stomoxys calcitrans TaxID=35570 RepID=UPI0027E38E00|nr:uncharacterized protein LOC131994740 [Stomoxys calcitrans]